jgi:hypothetical protein
MMMKLHPNFHFFFVSGGGADPTMKSSMLFARVKGETEVRLAELEGIGRLMIWRPGWIRPLRDRGYSFGEKVVNHVSHVLSPILPSTDGVEIAKAMFWATFNHVDNHLFENKDIKKLAALERGDKGEK